MVVAPIRDALASVPFVGTAAGAAVILVGIITGRPRPVALGAVLAAMPPTFAHIAFDPAGLAVAGVALVVNLALIVALRAGVPLLRIALWGAALVALEYTAIVTAAVPDHGLGALAGRSFLGQVGAAFPAPDLAIIAGLVLSAAAAVRAVLIRDALARGVAWMMPVVLAGAGPEAAPAAAVAASTLVVAALVAGTHALAYRDALTGLPGRRAFDEALSALRAPFAIAAVDVDHFKRVNDTHGHDVGDQVLRMVAEHLGTVPGAAAYRVGGEEFALVFAGTNAAEAQESLDRLRVRIEASPFGLRGPDRPRHRPKQPKRRASTRHIVVTVSIGVAEATGHTPAGDVLQAADRALYRAKEGGRNRVLPARARDYPAD